MSIVPAITAIMPATTRNSRNIEVLDVFAPPVLGIPGVTGVLSPGGVATTGATTTSVGVTSIGKGVVTAVG